MKKAIFGLAFAIAASFAATVRADGYEDWFTPSGGFSKQPTFDVWVEVGSWNTYMPFSITDDIGSVYDTVHFFAESVPTTAKNAFELAEAALISAIYAQCQAKLNECKINNIASAIEGIVVASYGEYHDQAGRVISKSKANIARDQLLKSKNSIAAGNGATEGTQDDPLVVEVLETPFSSQTFEQDTRKEGESKTILKGVPALTEVSGSSFPFSSGLYLATGWIPLITSKDGDLTWKAWNGVDTGVLSVGAGTGGDDGRLGLKDWNGGNGGCELNLKGLLTSKEADYVSARNSHTIMTRCNDNGTYKLHYMSVGGLIDSLTGVDPDEASIETYIDGDTTNLCVYGFNEAKDARTENDKVPTIPNLKPTGDKLSWTSFSDFFADSVFKTSETTGKVLLNGTKEGDKKVQVLAMQYGDTDDDQTLSHFSGDGKSIDFGFTPDGQTVESPLAQLHNFDVAPSPYGGYSTFTFADTLTNLNASINGMSIPVRYPAGNRVEIGYIPMGKVTGIPSASVDDLTIENSKDEGAGDDDPDKLRIKGAKTATKGQLLKMGDEGQVEWGDFPIEVDLPEGLEEDEYPLYITEADPENDEPAKIGIDGWETVDSPEGLYGAGNGKPIMYRFADIQSLEADSVKQTVELKGYDDAGRYSMPFKGESDDGLGWVAPPSSGSALLTMNAGSDPTATVLGNSVETETVSGKATLNIKNFTNGGGCDTTMSEMMTSDSQSLNRSRHQVLTRYTGGSNPAVHWVDMGDKISGGGSPVDDSSITTNTAHGATASGVASIYGFSTASAGDVPHKKADGSIEWKPVAAGGALLVQGNYDSTVATCTNKLIFASESDSNVKFKVTDEGNGNVKITVGVYYK